MNKRAKKVADGSWYAAMTGPRQGEPFEAQFRLNMAGYKTLLLFERVHKKHKIAGRPGQFKTRWTRRAYFPRYMFAQVNDDQDIATVNNTEGISTVVYAGDEPLVVPDIVIDEMRALGDLAGCVDTRDETKPKHFIDGQTVRFVSGALQGWTGTLNCDKQRIKVFVEALRREVIVARPTETLEAI